MGNNAFEKTGYAGIFRKSINGKYLMSIELKNDDGSRKLISKVYDNFDDAYNARQTLVKERDKQNEAIRLKKAEEKKKKAEAGKHLLCSDNCRDCRYRKLLNAHSNIIYCDYLMMTGKHRGCNCGDGCIVKEPYDPEQESLRRKYYMESFRCSLSPKWNKERRVTRDLRLINS